MIVAPLISSEGESIGAIQMDTLNPRRRFEESDLEILAAVAAQVGVAIENAQLHEQLLDTSCSSKISTLPSASSKRSCPASIRTCQAFPSITSINLPANRR